MKKSFLLLLVIAIPFFSEAQAQPGVSLNDRTKPAEIKITDTLQEGDLSNINWGALINRDFVAIGEKFHDVPQQLWPRPPRPISTLPNTSWWRLKMWTGLH